MQALPTPPLSTTHPQPQQQQQHALHTVQAQQSAPGHAQPQAPVAQGHPGPVDPTLRAYADANALLHPTRTGLINIFDGLLARIARELQARQEELAHAKAVNARIERDYRDLYQLAIQLQRIKEQQRGEVDLLRLRKGADGAAAAAVWDRIKGREDSLWDALDLCVQKCQCGAARRTLSSIVLPSRTSSETQPPAPASPHNHDQNHNQHQRDTSAHSHVASHSPTHASEGRPTTQSIGQSSTPMAAAHRRFSTGPTTVGSPIVQTAPNSAYQSPVMLNGPSTFASLVAPTRPPSASTGNAVNAGAFQVPVNPATPIVVQPPVVPSQIGVAQPAVPQPQPRPQHHAVPSQPQHTFVPSQPQRWSGLTPEQLLQLAEHPSQARNRHALRMEAMTMIHRAQTQTQAQGRPVQDQSPTTAMNGQLAPAGAANDQAQGLKPLSSYPERQPQPQPQPQAGPSTSAALTPRPQGQIWPNLPKAARMALVGLNDPKFPLRDALRARAGLTASAPQPITPTTSTSTSLNNTSTPARSDIRAKLLSELAARLREFSPLEACVLLNLTAEQNKALAVVSLGGSEGLSEECGRAIESLSQVERSAVVGLINALSGEGNVGGRASVNVNVEVKKERAVIDLTEDDKPVAFTAQPEEMKAEPVEMAATSSTSRQPETPHSQSAMDGSPSRRRARSDSGVGTDISDSSIAGEGRAVKRARMSIDDGVPAQMEMEEGEFTSPHLRGERLEGGREIQRTLTPDAAPRFRAVTVASEPSIDSTTPSLPERQARMVEREEAPAEQGSTDPRALTATSQSTSAAPTTVPPLPSVALTAFVNTFLHSLSSSGAGEKEPTETEQIMGAITQAESASGVVQGTVETAYAGSSTSQSAVPPPVTPTPAPRPPAPVASAPPMERTQSIPIEPTVLVRATGPTTPAASGGLEPSPFVRPGFEASSSVTPPEPSPPREKLHGQPDHSPVPQSGQVSQMRQQAGYNGPYTSPPPHPHLYEAPIDVLPPPVPQAPMGALPHVSPDLEVGVGGELPRLPDKATEGKVLGPDHLALLFGLDDATGGWACRLCLQRKEVDETFPVPVYSTGDGSMPDGLIAIMSAHAADTHAEAFAYIADLDDEAAREELREMMED